MITSRTMLFDGRAAKDSALVWLEPDGDGVIVRRRPRELRSDGLQTALHIGASELEVLAAALIADHPELDSTAPATEVLAGAYRGDSEAATHLRERLDALGLASALTLR